MITRDQIKAFSPDAIPAWTDALSDIANELCKHYEFQDADWRHLIGQIGAETNGLSLRTMRENMRFTSASRLREVYSYRLRLALERDKDLRREHGTVDGLARFLVGKPDLLADIVYGGREGTPHMQGHRYIGRGPTQITHLNNYRAIRDAIRKQPGGGACPDLVERPDSLELPEWGVRSAFADWNIKGLSKWARDDDIENVSSVLNVGSPGKISQVNGMPNRRRWYAKAVAVWPLDSAVVGPAPADLPEEYKSEPAPPLRRGDECEAVSDLQLMLEGLGFHVGEPDGCYGELTERAVVVAQHAHGLPPTGVADAKTVEVLKRSAPLPLPRDDMTAEDLKARGSRTVSKAGEVSLWGRALKYIGLGGGGGAGFVETASPGTIVNLVDTGAQVVERLIAPKLLVFAGLITIGLIGWRLSSNGNSILGYRLADARSGKHIGR